MLRFAKGAFVVVLISLLATVVLVAQGHDVSLRTLAHMCLTGLIALRVYASLPFPTVDNR